MLFVSFFHVRTRLGNGYNKSRIVKVIENVLYQHLNIKGNTHTNAFDCQ